MQYTMATLLTWIGDFDNILSIKKYFTDRLWIKGGGLYA